MTLAPSRPPRPRRTRVDRARGRAFGLTTGALLALIAGTELPTPLYVAYQHRFGFSDSVLTLVFAVYALVLIPVLIVSGRAADRIGRWPMLVAGMLVAGVGAAVLAAATGTGWLFVGRVLQGVGVGAATGAATAALADLRSRTAALWATVAVAAGGASGPLVAGLLAQYAPWPLRTCYLLQLVVLAVLLAGLVRVRAAFARGDGVVGPTPGPPGVPRSIRTSFARVGLVVFTVWAVGGLYTAIVPTYVGTLLSTDNLALLGGVPFLMLAVAAVAQLTLRRVRSRHAQPLGCAALVIGVAALVVAFPTHSLVWVVVSAVADGLGLGLGFLGAQTDLLRMAPPGRQAEVSGAFNVCLYLGVSLPVIGTGLLADRLSLFAAVVAFAALVAALAVLAAVVTLRAAAASERDTTA